MAFVSRTTAAAWFVFLMVLCPIATIRAQDSPADEMIYKYLCAETDKLSKKVFDGARNIDDWKRRRPRLHREYLYMLGLDPLPKKTPLKVTFTGSFEHEGIVVDKLHFQSSPGLYVTANLYRPKGTQQKPQPGAKHERYPAVLYVCGHAGRGRNGNKSAYQDHGIWFARNGYICIMLDTLQLGEIPGVHHGTYGVPWRHLRAWGVTDKKKLDEGPRWWWHSAGYTPAGVECWNGIRAIDYLVSRPDVDPKRIAVTGISGGGAATFWIAAADDRVACAVPVSGMSDLESYVKNKVINGHCDCMFMYNTFRWDWTTIAALVAPRPLMFANSDNDPIFPMDGNRRIAAKLRKLYQWYGKPENFKEYVSHGGHAYRPDLRIAIFKFINKHVKGYAGPVEDTAGYERIPGEKLRVFPTDADLPRDFINQRVDEVFVPRAKVKLPTRGEFAEWKADLLEELRQKCFRALPERATPLRIIDGKKDDKSVWYNVERGDGIRLEIVWSRNRRVPIDSRYPIAMQISGDPGQWLLSYRAIGYKGKSPPNYVRRSHVLLGMTLDERRLGDVIALAAFARPKGMRVLRGRGQAGILAAYAALFEPSIKEVVIVDPPTSHTEGPHFLNVLRVCDIPEALGLLAPRVKLTLIHANDRVFDRTAEIYRIAGAADKFVRK